MLKVIANNYYNKYDYRFLEILLRKAFLEEMTFCEKWHLDCNECTTKKACKDMKQLIDYLHTINK